MMLSSSPPRGPCSCAHSLPAPSPWPGSAENHASAADASPDGFGCDFSHVAYAFASACFFSTAGSTGFGFGFFGFFVGAAAGVGAFEAGAAAPGAPARALARSSRP